MADPAAMELYMQAMAEFAVRQQQRLETGDETSDAVEENREATAALLLLVFALSAQAGRCEARGLLKLTATTATLPMLRRAAFVVAGLAWSLLLALPAAIVRGSGEPLLLALTTGAAASVTAITLAALTGSSFAPRVVLLIAWYVYFSS